MIETDALFGKTDGLFCKTDICYEVSNMHMCCIRFSNRLSYRPNRGLHIVPCGKIHRIGGAPPETFSCEKYDVPEEVDGDRKSFDSPIRK